MNVDELNKLCNEADIIVCGYAFTKMPDSNIRVLQLRKPNHALVLSSAGEILETSMDDVELDVVRDYWLRNKKYLEKSYAEVL